MNLDKICGMLITYKYFKNILKKFIYGKNMNINHEKRMNLNKQISGLKDGFDLVQFCIKNIVNSKNKERTLEGLKESSGFIRSRVANTVNLRITPEIVFIYDDSEEQGARIDAILERIKREGK